MSLFGNAAAGGRSSSKNLVEFRAGKMSLKGTTVTPDKRKGLVYLYQSEDSLMHFCWKDRTSGNDVEDDLIIFPDDCEFKRVTQCTTGRVYILKFKSSSRKFFFWLQEPKTDKDEDNCKKVNETLNNPPAPGSSGGGRGGGLGGLPPELAGLGGEAGLQSMLGNMDQQQLLQLLGSGGLGGLGNLGGQLGLSGLMGPGSGRPGSGQSGSSSAAPSRVQSSPGPRPTTGPPSQPRAATAQPTTGSTGSNSSGEKKEGAASTATPTPSVTGGATAGGQAPIQLSDLQNILSNLIIPTPGGATAEQQPPVDMTQVLSSEAMAPILANPELQKKLLPHLPEGELLPRDPEQLRTTLQNPQFQQAVNMFTAAFQSGQLGPLMAQFGLGEKATEAANKGDLVAFSQALQGGKSDDKKEKKDEEKDKDDKKKDEPEEMALD